MGKLFGTDGIRAIANTYPLTIKTCIKLAHALMGFLDKSNPEILIGKDTRESCHIFEHTLANALSTLGATVKLLGIVPTPAVAVITNQFAADLGIVISASHNSYKYNGIKIFKNNCLKLSHSEESQIESLIFTDFKFQPSAIGSIVEDSNAAKIYQADIIRSFSFNAKGKKIIVDCANGAMSNIAPQIFAHFGFNVVSENCWPNGKNINDNCGAAHQETLSHLTKKYVADIGVAFDGDGDRVVLCDENGQIMNGDQILARLSEHQQDVVSTVMANMELENFLKIQGKSLIRTDVGDKHIAEYMQNHSDVNLGGEPSGHIIIRDHGLTGDGLFAALCVLDKYFKSSYHKFSDFSHAFEPVPTISSNIQKNDKMSFDMIQAIAAKYQSESTRIVLRPSGTEPVIRLLVEGNGNINSIAKAIISELETA